MFGKKEPTPLDKAYERGVRALELHEFGSDDYVKTMRLVTTLWEMKERQTPAPASKDTLAVVSANLIGILMIIRHESVNIVTSKALGFILKPRI